MSIRPDLHDADGLERYKRGMDASRSDKAAILPLIHGRQILELGCGNGAVLSLIAGAYPEAKITGLDFASGLLHAAAQRDYGTADVRLIRADAHSEAYELKGGQLYDSVVLCSFLHEIFSGALQGGAAKGDFGDPFSAGNKAVKQLLGELRYVMEDSADLVIRDGIEPEPCELAVRFKSPSAEIAFHRFAEDYKGFPVSYEIRKDAGGSKALCPVRQTVYHMPSSTFYEFATKYIYADSPNWHIEMTEVFWLVASAATAIPSGGRRL